jgi:sarcosine oxidase delta subunit
MIRHVIIATASMSLAAGALALVTAAAQATVIGTPTNAVDIAFYKYPSAPATCTLAGTTATDTGPFAADGVAVTRTKSATTVLTNDTNPLDKTTLSGSGTSTVTATQIGGQLSHVLLTASMNASLKTDVANTQCGGTVTAASSVDYTFDLVRPTLVTLDMESSNFQGEIAVGQIIGSTPNAAAAIPLGAHRRSTDSVLLPAGTGFVSMGETGIQLRGTPAATTTSLAGSLKVDISFEDPGAPTTAADGGAKKYLSLGGRDCSTGAITATWSKKAGHGKHRIVTRATVTVNGTKVTTVKKPKRKQVTAIPADPTRAVQVQVFLKIKGKGQQFVQRSYRTCS